MKQARRDGLTIPVVFMGEYCALYRSSIPLLVDLPPEEAKDLRDLCTNEGLALRPLFFWDVLIHFRYRLSYIPLIVPSTSEARIQFLASIGDSFLYIVSKMGTTGANKGGMNAALPDLLSRVRHHNSGAFGNCYRNWRGWRSCREQDCQCYPGRLNRGLGNR